MMNVRIVNQWSRLAQALAAATCVASAVSVAAELSVRVSGIVSADGQIGCALFRGAEGFPMDNGVAQQQWHAANSKGVTCTFRDVVDGSYAVSVSHDLNGNKKVDTNFLGIPTEAWGVSNNARPLMRPPRFDEAAFRVKDGKDAVIDVQVAK